MKKIKEFFTSKEHGYSLLEISVAIGIMAIGLGIAIPNFDKALEVQSANDLKNKMFAASMIMESTRFQNNGAYPNEIPEEILNNPDYSDFTYSVDEENQNFCIMGRDDTNQKFFTNPDADDPYAPTEENPGCTEENVIWTPNPNDPNEPPVPTLIVTPPSIATGSNTWTRTNYTAALANFSWTSGNCTYSGALPSYMGGVGSIDYQARVVETASGNVYNAFNGAYVSANSVANLALDGWVPNSNIQYQVRMRCLADFEYNYTNWVALADTVDTFPVEDSATVADPAPEVNWPPTSEWPILTFKAAAITCPTADFTAVYKATVTQTGAATIVTPWQDSVFFTITLVGFTGNKNVQWTVTSGCEINDTIFEANEQYGGNEAIVADVSLPIPIPPPAPPTNFNCVTNYQRNTEATSGNCTYDATLPYSPTTPEAVRWTETECTVGQDYYEIRYSINGQSFSNWEGSNYNSQQHVFFDGFLVGVSVTAEVRAYCYINGESSEYSTSVSKTFTVDALPPDFSSVEVSWVGSTDGNGGTEDWLDTAVQQGDSFMYDRITGTAQSTCSNGFLPEGWRVKMMATYPGNNSVGFTNWKYINGTQLVIDRAEWSEAASSVWSRGAVIQMIVQALCPSGGVYDSVYTLSDEMDWPGIEIGYPILSTETINVTCVTKYQRTASAEASKGNCGYRASIAEQATVPNALSWTHPVCKTGYNQQYAVSSDGVTYTSWITTKTTSTYQDFALSGLTPDTSYTYRVKFKCVATSGKTSTESQNNNKTFTTSWPKSSSTPSAPTITWGTSTADSHWTETDGGNNPLTDRLTATVTASSCPSGYSISGLNVRVAGASTSGTKTFNGSSPFTINRSNSTEFATQWAEGLTFAPQASYNCANSDYADALTSTYATGSNITIGWTAPATSIVGFTCYVLDSRSPESSYGGCTQTTGLTVTSRAPQELRWNSISDTICSAKTGVPRYWVASSPSGPWTNNGSSTTYVVGNEITAGQSYTYYVQYDCYNSATGNYTGRSASTSKNFTASFLKGTVGSPTASWVTSTGDTSWSTTSGGTYSMIDRVTATLTNNPCPSGYSVASTPWGARLSGNAATISTNNSTTMILNRSATGNATYWLEGDNLQDVITYNITCTGGDYGSLSSAYVSPTTSMQIGILPPSGSSTVTISFSGIPSNGSTQQDNSAVASYSSSGTRTCGTGTTLNRSFSMTIGNTDGTESTTTSTSAFSDKTVLYGGSTTASLSVTCSKNGITSNSSTASSTAKVPKRTGNVVLVSNRAVGTGNTISGTYQTTCVSGSSQYNWNPVGYYAYRNAGIPDFTISFWDDPGTFTDTGFVGVSGDNDGSWSRSGYSTYEEQAYGFRISGQTCRNNQTLTTMDFNGWVTFWLKRSETLQTFNWSGFSYPTW